MQKNIIYPKQVILEVTNKCNIRCRFCHFHGIGAQRKRSIGFIDRDIWKKIIDEISTWNVELSLMSHGAGEPLLYKELPEFIKYAKKYKNIGVGFMTNGMLLNKWWADFILDIKMDFIAFSVDGVDREKHKYYRINTDLNLIEKNIMYLIEKKQKLNLSTPHIMMNMVVYPDLEGEKIKYVDRWKDHVNTIMLSKFRPIGSKKILEKNMNIQIKPCSYPFEQMVIAYDGRVGLCCEDINIDIELGDVKQNKLIDIFNNAKINKIRKLHTDLQLKDISLCAGCEVWAANTILEQKKINNTIYKKTPAGEIYECR